MMPFKTEIAAIAAGFVFRGDARAAAEIKKRYARFRCRRKPELLLEVRFKGRGQEPHRPAISFKGKTLRLKRGDFDCALDMITGLGALEIRPGPQSFDSFLRTFYSWALLRGGGCMLHSAAIVKDGKAYVFLGKSGAGKSTLSKLAASAGFEVISDEINMLKFSNGRFRVCGSPFWGEMRADGRPGFWPLGGVFLLKKAKANSILPCSKPAALKLLLRCLVNFSRSPEDAALIMENSARLLAGTRFAMLEFTKNNSGFLNLV